MDLTDLIKMAGGQDSVGKLADSLGLDTSKAADLIGALSPALTRGLEKQKSGNGFDGLRDALAGGNHQKYIDQPELMQEQATRDDGNKILGHLFGKKEVSRNVAAKAADKTGLDTSLVKRALPMIAGLAMAALSKKSNTASSPATSGGGLSDLLGSLTGGSGSDGDFGLDDVIGMAKKLF